jgi:kynureninase
VTSRAEAAALDAADPLAHFRGRFVIADPDVVYLDGNSLGRAPRATVERIAAGVRAWSEELVEGWERWIGLPVAVGDRVGRAALGAAEGQVVVADSTTVNLFKVVGAALSATAGRRAVVADATGFPTDRYVLQGLAAARDLDLRVVERADVAAVASRLDDDVAAVVLSTPAFDTGILADVPAITAAAHSCGALAVWDVSHAAGVVPLELDAWAVDFAVGCTYKYLNAGPGAPAFLYARREHQAGVRSPIWGWFGQRDQFAMDRDYGPAPGVARFLAGTPPVLGLLAVDEGAALVAEAGVGAIRTKSMALTQFLVECVDDRLAPLGFRVLTPREPERRGGHVAVAHDDAARISAAARVRANVVADFRPPDVLRLAPTPLDSRFVDVWEGVERLARLTASGAHLDPGQPVRRVT